MSGPPVLSPRRAEAGSQYGKLEPPGRVVDKVHSELFGEDILVCERDGERGKVDDGDIVRYTLAEVRELKKVAEELVAESRPSRRSLRKRK